MKKTLGCCFSAIHFLLATSIWTQQFNMLSAAKNVQTVLVKF